MLNKKFNFASKNLAVFLIAAISAGDLTGSQWAYAQNPATLTLTSPSSFRFPDRLNKHVLVEETFIPPAGTDKMVFFFQDAHGNISGQKNIAQSLGIVTQHLKIASPQIALEGTETGSIDHRALSAFPDKEIKELVSNFLLETGRLNSADYYASVKNPYAQLSGVDDGKLANKNREAYQSYLPYQKSVNLILSKISEHVQYLKTKVYSPDLLELDALSQNLLKQPDKFLQQLDSLKSFIQRYEIPMHAFPQMLELLNSVTNIQADARHFDTGKLLKEIQELENSLWENRLSYSEAKALRQIDLILIFYKKLFSFSLTPSDYASYTQNKNQYKIKTFTEKIRQFHFISLSQSLVLETPSIAILEKAMAYPLSFYSLAAKRNSPLIKHLEDLLKQSSDGKVFFISGGFHQEAITMALRKKNIGFILFSPRLENPEGHENYWKLLGGANSGIEILDTAVSTIQLRDSFKEPAFSKAVQVLLLAASSRLYPENAAANLTGYAERLPENLQKNISLISAKLKSAESPTDIYFGKDEQFLIRFQPFGIHLAQNSQDFPAYAPFLSSLSGISISQKRSELRNPVTITLPFESLRKTPGTSQQKLSAWLDDVSKLIAAAPKQIDSSVRLDTAVLKRFLEQVNWLNGALNEAKLALALEKHNFKASFVPSSPKSTDLASKELHLTFDTRALRALNQSNPSFAELFIALAIRNYFVGHILNGREEMILNTKLPEGKDASKKFERNTALAVQILKSEKLSGQKFLTALQKIQKTKSKDSQKLIWEKTEFVDTLIKQLTEADLAEDLDFTEAPVSNSNGQISDESFDGWLSNFQEAEKAGKLETAPALKDRYKILNKLGEGGFGVTYLANDQNLQTNVVIKITKKVRENQVGVDREWKAYAQLAESAYYPKILERWGMTTDHPSGYMVISLAKGQTLSAYDKENSSGLTAPQAVKIAAEIVKGLRDLHEMGAVHRDIKTDNVIANIVNGAVKKVTVLDLGLFKDLQEANAEQVENQAKQVTTAGQIVGTPSYIPPERTNNGYLTGSSDLFSVTVLLYKLLTKRIPGKGDESTLSPFGVMSNHATATYKEPKYYAPTLIDDELNLIILKGLSPAYPEMEKHPYYWPGIVQQVVSQKESGLRAENGRLLDPGNPKDLAFINQGRVLKRYGTADEMIATLNGWLQRHGYSAESSATGALSQSQNIGNESAFPVLNTIKSVARKSTSSSSAGKSKVSLFLAAGFAGFLAVATVISIIIFSGSKKSEEAKAPPEKIASKQNPINPDKRPTIISPSAIPSINNAYKFTLSHTGLKILNSENLKIGVADSTFTAWLYSEKMAPNTYYSLIDKGIIETEREFSLSINQNQVWVAIGQKSTLPQTINVGKPITANFSANRWHHLALIRKSDSIELFIDGNKTGEIKLAGQNLNSHPIILGGFTSQLLKTYNSGRSPAKNWEGYLSHVHLYSRALTETEIISLIENPGSIRTNLLGHWPLTKGDLADHSGNGNHALQENKRSEVRRLEKTSLPLKVLSTLIKSQEEAVLFLPYNEKMIEKIADFRKSLGLRTSHFVFVKQDKEKIPAQISKLESIYGFRVIDSPVSVEQLQENSPELENLLKRTAAAFGIPLTRLGIPIILANHFETRFDISADKLKNADLVPLQYNAERFLEDPSYQAAYLITATALSKKVYDRLDGLVFGHNGQGLTLQESFINQFKQDMQALQKLASAA